MQPYMGFEKYNAAPQMPHAFTAILQQILVNSMQYLPWMLSRKAENVQSAAKKEASPRENAIYPACATLCDSGRREIIFSSEKFSPARKFFLSF